MEGKFAIQAASFSEAIHVGRLNKARTAFTEKEEATDMALFAVAEYAQRFYNGALAVEFEKAGFDVQVTVTPRLAPAGGSSDE